MVEDTSASKIPPRMELIHAVVDTVSEPLLVLDHELRVAMASGSFYRTFGGSPPQTEGRLLYQLDNGRWDIPDLRRLLEQVLPEHTTIEEYVVEHEFPLVGARSIMFNARQVRHGDERNPTILLAMQDVTVRKALEREKDDLLRQKDLLLQEMSHRISNSLQIIASILLMKAKSLPEGETRAHLQETYQRVAAIATVQEHLEPTLLGDRISVSGYLRKLCGSLGKAVISPEQLISLRVVSNEGTLGSAHAVSMGLITTELVMNALKHAFAGRPTGEIVVAYEGAPSGWSLSVADDGIGDGAYDGPAPKHGLGKSIVEALARQLGGNVVVSASASGTRVVVTAQHQT